MFLEEFQHRPLVFTVFILIFLVTSYLSTSYLIILDLLFVRILLIFILLWSITCGPYTGVLAFLVIAALFLERNRRKLSAVKVRMYSDLATDMAAAEGADGLGNDGIQKGPERTATVEEESESQKNVSVPPYNTPELGNVWKWNPEDNGKYENWSKVAPSINLKKPVRTIAGGSKTWTYFIENSLAGEGIDPEN